MRTVAYLLIWVPVAILGCVASFSVLSLSNALDLRYLPYWIVMAMNLVPAFVCGVGCYYLAGRPERASQRSSANPAGHFLRAAPLYLIIALLIAFIVANNSDKSFGLVAQLFIWPLFATLGGIVGDLLVGVQVGRARRAAAA